MTTKSKKIILATLTVIAIIVPGGFIISGLIVALHKLYSKTSTSNPAASVAA